MGVCGKNWMFGKEKRRTSLFLVGAGGREEEGGDGCSVCNGVLCWVPFCHLVHSLASVFSRTPSPCQELAWNDQTICNCSNRTILPYCMNHKPGNRCRLPSVAAKTQ